MKKVLFIRSDRLGEFLLSLPAIKLFKLNYPQSDVYLLAQKTNIELTKDVDFIDYFLEYKENSFSGFKGVFRLAACLRKEKIDCLVAMNPKKEFHLAAKLAGIPLRVGYDRKWGWCLNKKIKDKKYLEEKHEVEYNIELVRLICGDLPALEVDLKVDGQESLDFLKEDLDISSSYLIVHPFTSNPLKKVYFEFWRSLIRRLKEKGFENIVLIGATSEKEEAKELAAELGIIDLVGTMSLRNLAAFMKYNCSAFVGLDSGPMHLASLFKIPVVSLFTTSNPKRWGPWKTKSLVFELKPKEDFSNQVTEAVNFILKQ
ncbi:MAG: glycosyltransferase family 9 protein [Candidatus Omnitrophica bacterium]|nr:glycosyltransferase family 9 protein [Candidatus Omnitrophota bacterium]